MAMRTDHAAAPSHPSGREAQSSGEEEILLGLSQRWPSSSARPCGSRPQQRHVGLAVVAAGAAAAAVAAVLATSGAPRGSSVTVRRPGASVVGLVAEEEARGLAYGPVPRPRFCSSGGRSTPAAAVEFGGALLPRKLPFTLLADIRTDAEEAGQRQVVLDWGAGDTHCAKIELNEQGALEYWENNQGQWNHVAAEPKLNLVDGKWHHIAIVRGEDGDIEFLGDGGLLLGIGQLAQPDYDPGACGLFARTTSDFDAGGGEGNTFRGDVSVLRIYTSALQRAQVSAVGGPCTKSWAEAAEQVAGAAAVTALGVATGAVQSAAPVQPGAASSTAPGAATGAGQWTAPVQPGINPAEQPPPVIAPGNQAPTITQSAPPASGWDAVAQQPSPWQQAGASPTAPTEPAAPEVEATAPETVTVPATPAPPTAAPPATAAGVEVETGMCQGRSPYENILCSGRGKTECVAVGNCLWVVG